LTHERLECEPAPRVHGVVLSGACHWREVQVREIAVPPAAASASRADVITRVVGAGTLRPFVGLCRAKHAVVEASILAPRLRFGSIGVALERPRYVVEVRHAPHGEVDGEVEAELSRIIETLGDDARVPGSIAVRVLERIPRHQGLGSGTQRDLALGCALSRLAGRTLTASEIAGRLGRGRRSGVGIATFERGGLVVDAGVVRGAPAGSIESKGVPP